MTVPVQEATTLGHQQSTIKHSWLVFGKIVTEVNMLPEHYPAKHTEYFVSIFGHRINLFVSIVASNT